MSAKVPSKTIVQPTPRFRADPPFEKDAAVPPDGRGSIDYIWYTDSDDQLRQVNDKDDLRLFLKSDLDVSRVNEIHEHLWWAGLPRRPRPLHKHAMVHLDVIVSEQIDLHLTWRDTFVYIKPLPPYLLDWNFWQTNLCDDKELYGFALGLLYSYCCMILYPADLEIGKSKHLLPKDLTWQQWTKLMKSALAYFETLDHFILMNKRYSYGELRLRRLNQICRFVTWSGLSNLNRGYYSHYTRYASFFERNFSWLVTAFLVITTLLGAMQVGLATPSGNKPDGPFQHVSWVFAIIALVASVAAVVIGGMLFALLFLFNLISTLQYRRRRKQLVIA